MSKPAMLHMMCGKIATGKSTLAANLGSQPATVLLVEDDWLSTLYPDELHTGSDYLRCSTRLHAILGPHVADILRAGVTVVLDFPANVPAQRRWMRDILDATGAPHELHVLDLPDDVLLDRLRARNARGDHPYMVSEDMFHRFSKMFEPPSPEEGFNIVHHR